MADYYFKLVSNEQFVSYEFYYLADKFFSIWQASGNVADLVAFLMLILKQVADKKVKWQIVADEKKNYVADKILLIKPILFQILI